MDLLRYLIVPPTAETHPRDSTGASARENAVLSDVAAGVFERPNRAQLPVNDRSPAAPGNGDANRNRKLGGSRGSSVSDSSSQVCSFWYHFGECRRDNAHARLGGLVCAYRHSLPGGGDTIAVQKVPRQMRKYICGLKHCPWEQSRVQRKRMPMKGKDAQTHRKIAKPATSSQGKQQAPKPAKKSKKRKQHPDEPVAQPTPAIKRQQVPYEDPYSDKVPTPFAPRHHFEKANAASKQTCFFWYHGTCARGSDPKGCSMKHGLQDPPATVKPPPRYVHQSPCEL